MHHSYRLGALLGAFLFATSAVADNAVLENEYVRAGVNETTGTFGSGGNTSPGLLYDSTGTGTFNTSYDYLTPGSPFDGFSVKILDTEGGTATNYANNNAGGEATISGGWTAGTTNSASGADWTGTWTHNSTTWTLRNQYGLPTGQQFIDITTTITAGSDAHTVWLGRFIDPDARAADGDSSSTDNVLGYSGIPSTNVAFSEALSSRYALGLYSTNSNVAAGISNWTKEADGYTSSIYTDGDGNAVNFGQGDDTIGLTWVWTGVSANDIITANYSYIFGPSAFDAATEAVDGGAGGGTAGELPSSWGTLEDVGSATDAASGAPAAPTVTGTSTTTLTHHDVADDGAVQTVDRTLHTASVDVYSDGSLGTPVTSVSQLAPRSGRVDQYATMEELDRGISRSLNIDPWREGGIETPYGKFFINADVSKSSLANDYSARSRSFGVTGEFEISPDWKIAASVNRITSDITGTDSDGSLTKTHFGVANTYIMNPLMFVTDVNFSKNDYQTSRTVESFYFNESSSSGQDIWVKQRVYVTMDENMVPFVGAGFGKFTRDATTESGSALTARNIAESDETVKYGEAGLRLMASVSDFDLYGQMSYTTDKYMTVEAGIDYNMTINSSIGIGVKRQTHEDTTTDSFGIRANIQF